MGVNRLFSLALICGAIWNVCPIGGALLSPLLPAVVVMAGSKSSRWLISFIWFLSGSVSIIPAAAGFFGWHSIGIGLGAWVVSAAILALPWVIAKSPTGAVIAIIIDAIPPIGLVDWLSPLSSAGLFFPGQGIAGLAGCLLLIGLVTALANSQSKYTPRLWVKSTMVLWIMIGNLTYVSPAQSTGWIGIQTKLHPSDGKALLSIGNIRSMIVSAQLQAKHARIVVFPEAVLDNWWLGTQKQIAAAVPPGQLWLIGAQTQAPRARWDAMVAVRQNQADITPVFKAALPMPISMWQPGFKGSYLPAWWEPVTIIDGKRVWANICFDQVLPWVWMEGVMQQPDLVILPSNSWWAQSWNPAPTIRKAEATAWGRLMGVAVVFASNNSPGIM